MDCKKFEEPKFRVSGDVMRYNSADEDNFTQVCTFFKKVSKYFYTLDMGK